MKQCLDVGESPQITSLCFYNLMTCDFCDYFYLQSTNFH